jgi:hypothetical protein
MRISDSENFLHLAVDWFSVLIDSLGDGPMMSGELALMPRSNALAGVNPATGCERRFPPAHSFPR